MYPRSHHGHPRHHGRSIARFASTIAAALLAVGAAHAAPTAEKGRLAAAEQRYQKERAACLDGTSNQDKSTCLKEATNALDEARKHPSPMPDRAELRSNKLQRCDYVREADQAACRRLALGKGQESGSVEGGGVIKETRTITVGPPIVIVPVQ